MPNTLRRLLRRKRRTRRRVCSRHRLSRSTHGWRGTCLGRRRYRPHRTWCSMHRRTVCLPESGRRSRSHHCRFRYCTVDRSRSLSLGYTRQRSCRPTLSSCLRADSRTRGTPLPDRFANPWTDLGTYMVALCHLHTPVPNRSHRSQRLRPRILRPDTLHHRRTVDQWNTRRSLPDTPKSLSGPTRAVTNPRGERVAGTVFPTAPAHSAPAVVRMPRVFAFGFEHRGRLAPTIRDRSSPKNSRNIAAMGRGSAQGACADTHAAGQEPT